jgi:hypothetical protein
MVAFELWVILEVIIGIALYYNLKPYYKVWRAYRNPYKYVGRSPRSYRGMYKIQGKHKMVEIYLSKNNFCIK